MAAKKTRPAGVARIPRRSKGWYRDPDTGDRLRSVTTILGEGAPKEALIYWAGNLVAQTAMDYLPDLVRASRTPKKRSDAYDWLRRAPTRKKNDRADIGSAVHKLIEAHILGEPAPADLLGDPEMRPYLLHFQAFVVDYAIEFDASEMVVANPGEGYAGTLDYIARSPHLLAGKAWMGDTKTGGELDVKGVYPEAGLQMAAYRHAQVCWLRDGTKLPMPSTEDTGYVLHLRPEGYRLIPVRCDTAVFDVFRHVIRVAEWTRELSGQVVGDPVPIPTKLKETA